MTDRVGDGESEATAARSDERQGAIRGAVAASGADRPALLDDVIESARRFGVELDADEAERWVEAIRVESAGGDIVVDVDSGIFGHRVAMLDFTERDLARFRRIGRVVGIEDRLPDVRTALAISGSAAQGRIQAFPGDCDFFERVHIAAPTREIACAILAGCIRDKALTMALGPTYRLWEVKFGSYPWDAERDGRSVRAGGPITWTPQEVVAGEIALQRDGVPVRFTWREAAADPAGASSTGSSPTPSVARSRTRATSSTSRGVRRTARSPRSTAPWTRTSRRSTWIGLAPAFTRLVHELSADAVGEYVGQLEHEVVKYVVDHPNYGKVARRLYNIFRLTGDTPRPPTCGSSSTSRPPRCTRSPPSSGRSTTPTRPAATSTRRCSSGRRTR